MDPLRDPSNPERTGTYVAGSPYRCHACTAISDAQQSFAKDLSPEHHDVMNGLSWLVEYVPRAPRPHPA